MKRSAYEILGGAGDPVLVIRLKNLDNVIKKQGGAAGGLAMWAAPQSITNVALEAARKKLEEGFRKEGVDAEVTIAAAAPTEKPPKGEFFIGVVAGALGLGLLGFGGWTLWTKVLKKWVVR